MSESEELIIARRELAFQRVQIEIQASELMLAQNELVIQYKAKEGQAEELHTMRNELSLQNEEKQKRVEELIIANIEKQKRADDLVLANKELIFQNEEKQRRADELILTNKELAFQYEEKEKLTGELTIAYGELKKTEEYLRDYIKGLEEMMFITSHKVRQPVAEILGISNLLDQSINYSYEEMKKIVGYLKQSALSLDTFTKELTLFMVEIDRKGKEKRI